MRRILFALLLAAAVARGEVFPLRGGTAVTGELTRAEHGTLVIRTAAGVSNYRAAELPRAWTDAQWERIGIVRPPRRGHSFSETWHGVFRSEGWAEAASYLQADLRGALAVGVPLALAGLWFCCFGACLTRGRRWGAFLGAIAALGALCWLMEDLAGAGRLVAAWEGQAQSLLAGWWVLHSILFLLLLSPDDGRRFRRFGRARPAVILAGALSRSTIVRMALFGALLVAQGLWIAAAAQFGVAEAQAKDLWIAVAGAAAAAAVVGVLLQFARVAREIVEEGI